MQQKQLYTLLGLLVGSMALAACDGGSNNNNVNNTAVDSKTTVGTQWTHQIGQSFINSNGSNYGISYEPKSKMLYRVDAKQICSISESADKNDAWNCVKLNDDTQLSGYSMASEDVIPDNNGNVYAFASSPDGKLALLKGTGMQWAPVDLQGTLEKQTIVSNMLYTAESGGQIHVLTRTDVNRHTQQWEYKGIDITVGTTNLGVIAESTIDFGDDAKKTNSFFTLSNVGDQFYIGIVGKNTIGTSNGKPIPLPNKQTVVAISATHDKLYACTALQNPTDSANGTIQLNTPIIARNTAETSSAPWENIGYTSVIPGQPPVGNVYHGCSAIYAYENKVFAIGEAGIDADNHPLQAVFTQN